MARAYSSTHALALPVRPDTVRRLLPFYVRRQVSERVCVDPVFVGLVETDRCAGDVEVGDVGLILAEGSADQALWVVWPQPLSERIRSAALVALDSQVVEQPADLVRVKAGDRTIVPLDLGRIEEVEL